MSYPHRLMGPISEPPVVLDRTRALLLASSVPLPFQYSPVTLSSTVCLASVKPRRILEWKDADIRVAMAAYWATVVSQNDMVALVTRNADINCMEELISRTSVTAEEHIRNCIHICPVNYLNLATTSIGGRTPPSDDHSKCVNTAGQSSAMSGFIGVSDYAFYDGVSGILKGIMEAECPWNVTPQDIEKVRQGTTRNECCSL